jgi:RNA polymerase sigma-70 factor (ECF subfamily)
MPGESVNPFDSLSLNPLTDRIKKLLSKAQSGENAAFGELYELCFDKIYRFVFYRVGHKEIAEDITEEVFVKAFESLKSLNQTASFEAWLYQIARNRVIDYYRSKNLLTNLEDVEHSLEYDTNLIDVVNLKTEQKIFVKLLKELPTEQQIVIKLKFLEDLTNQEISELLHKPEGTIRVIQHRAIAKLKQLIQSLIDKTTHGTDEQKLF